MISFCRMLARKSSNLRHHFFFFFQLYPPPLLLFPFLPLSQGKAIHINNVRTMYHFLSLRSMTFPTWTTNGHSKWAEKRERKKMKMEEDEVAISNFDLDLVSGDFSIRLPASQPKPKSMFSSAISSWDPQSPSYTVLSSQLPSPHSTLSTGYLHSFVQLKKFIH